MSLMALQFCLLAGAAAARMHDIAINARTLATLYATHTDAVRAGNAAGINASSYNFTPAAGIQVFGEDLAIASRRVLAQQMEEMTLELKVCGPRSRGGCMRSEERHVLYVWLRPVIRACLCLADWTDSLALCIWSPRPL